MRMTDNLLGDKKVQKENDCWMPNTESGTAENSSSEQQ